MCMCVCVRAQVCVCCFGGVDGCIHLLDDVRYIASVVVLLRFVCLLLFKTLSLL